MKTDNRSVFVTAGLMAALYQPLASAAEPVQNYLNTRYGGTVMSGSGECVRTLPDAPAEPEVPVAEEPSEAADEQTSSRSTAWPPRR